MSDTIKAGRMKAVFLEKTGGPLVTREVEIPAPVNSDVLIKMSAAPVNPSDLARLRKPYVESDLKTFIPGLEGSGIVVGAGKGLLPKLWMGKRVACSAHYSTSGTWAEYMVTPAGMCFPLGKKVDDEQGSMSLVNPLTALAFSEIIKREGHKAIVVSPGASSLGRMVELLANKMQIPVINIVRNDKQVEKLKVMGIRYILDSSDPLFLSNLKTLSEQLNATILFDSVCSSDLKEMIESMPFASSVVIYGNLTGDEEITINPRSFIDRNIRVSGFFLGNAAKENGLLRNILNLREVNRMLSSDLKINIRARFPLDKAQEAVDSYGGNMSAGKVLFVMS